MCTALLSIDDDGQMLLVGVRDEMLARAWEPPARHWPDLPGLIGGRDLVAGGTWLAVSPEDRRAACVLNGRGRQAPAATRRSRGALPVQAAIGKPLDRSALADLDPFHLLVAEPGHASLQSWDGRDLLERELRPGLHLAVNSGLASDLHPARPPSGKQAHPAQPLSTDQPRTDQPRTDQPRTDQPTTNPPRTDQPATAGYQVAATDPPTTDPPATDPPAAENGRAHELARIAYFLPRFTSAARPHPQPGQPVAEAWGEWFPLLNGAGLPADDERALIVRRDFGDGRVWGTGSISLVALSPAGLRYDFTARPGDPSAWYTIA
jgi:Transport and Golgi organisation 2